MTIRSCSAIMALAGLLIACGGGGGDGGGDVAPPPVARPALNHYPLTLGDRWTYVDGSAQLTHVRVMEAVELQGRSVWRIRSLDADGSSDEYIERSANAVVQVPDPATSDPVERALGPVQLLRLPLVRGERFTSLDRTLAAVADFDGDRRADDLSVRMDVEVIDIGSMETVLGPQQNVAQVRTTLTQRFSLSSGGEVTAVTVLNDAYAPDLGRVRSSFHISGAGLQEQGESQLRDLRVGTRRSSTQSPQIAEITPAADSLAQTAMLRVRFDKDMDPLGPEPLGLQLRDPSGQLLPGRSLWEGLRTLRFEPAVALASGRYTLQVSPGAEDLAGNRISAGREQVFRIDREGPLLLSVTPADGAREVALNTPIRLRFDEPLQLEGLENAVKLEGPMGSLWVDFRLQGNELTLLPREPLQPRRTYTVQLYAVRDALGNASPTVWQSFSFRTDPGLFAEAAPLAGLPEGGQYLLADLNGDRRADALRWENIEGAPSFRTGVVLRLQQVDGRFATTKTLPDDASLSHALMLTAPDASGLPGVLDLHFDQLSHLRWRGEGLERRMLSPIGAPLGGWMETSLRIAADGGRRALLLQETAGPRQLMLREAAVDQFTISSQNLTPFSLYNVRMTAGDLNGDGREDLLMDGAPEYRGVLWQQANGSLSHEAGGDAAWFGHDHLSIADLDGDGQAELISASNASLRPQIWRRDARGAWVLREILPMGGSGTPTGLLVADLDRDGRPDIAMAAAGGVSLYLQRSDGRFGAAEVYHATQGNSGSQMDLVDVDGDGLPDLRLGTDWLRLRRPAAPALSPLGLVRRLPSR